MIAETERRLEQEQEKEPLTIPVAVLTRDGEVFVIREKFPEKYTINEWRLLTGRPWRGEEGLKDLAGIAEECGFRINDGEIIGTVNGDKDHEFYAGRKVVFNFYNCPVVDGDFAPNIIHPDENSNQNQYNRYEGQWFKIKQLRREKHLHPLVEKVLEFLQKTQK